MSTALDSNVGTWQPDPWGRHQHRWYDGQNWTATVADHGVQSIDLGAATSSTQPMMVAPTLPTSYSVSAQHDHPATGTSPAYHQLNAPTTKRPKRRLRRVANLTLVVALALLAGVIAIIVLAPGDEYAATPVEQQTVPMLLGPTATHQELPVDAAMFGADWPLTIDAGTIVCEALPSQFELSNVFFVDPAGVVYAVNGTAMGTSATYGWSDIDLIWKANPVTAGLKVDISPIISAGLDICDPAPRTDTPIPQEVLSGSTSAVWAMSTPEQQAAYCTAWTLAPELARESFISGSDEAAQYWPSLEQTLKDNC